MFFFLIIVAPLATVPVDQTYSQGDDITLVCTAMGGPGNIFQWFNNSNILLTTSSLLVLPNVTTADGGEYRCVVSNAAGTSKATTSIFISPYFTTQPQDTAGMNGSTVTLICEAEAFPSPTYQWSRVDGMTIRNAVTGENSSVLMFSSLEFGDEGLYHCSATSKGMVIQSQFATLSGKALFLIDSYRL